MPKGDFAIVGEGITDQIVIKSVLLGFFDHWDDDPFIVFEQPPNDATATARQLKKAKEAGTPPPGGWTLVMQYFEQKKYLEALQNNRYLVVHLDTDVCEEYGVARADDGQLRTPEVLIEMVIAIVRERIGAEDWAMVGHRMLFAVGIDSLECWLLALVFDRSKKEKAKKTARCLDTINHELKKQKRNPLSDFDGSHKDPAAYIEVASDFQKGKTLRGLSVANSGLEFFLAQIERARIQPPEDIQ